MAKADDKKVEDQEAKNAQIEQDVREDSKRSTAGDVPFADESTDPDKAREPQVGEPVTTSFDERTSTASPWLTADGRQDNGLADLDEVEGASRTTSREGDKTTVEETEVAIHNGDVEGAQHVDEELEAPKNPVK